MTRHAGRFFAPEAARKKQFVQFRNVPLLCVVTQHQFDGVGM